MAQRLGVETVPKLLSQLQSLPVILPDARTNAKCEVKTDFDFAMNFAVIMGKWATTMFLKLFWFLILFIRYKNLEVIFFKLFVVLFLYHLHRDKNLSNRTVLRLTEFAAFYETWTEVLYKIEMRYCPNGIFVNKYAKVHNFIWFLKF